MRVACATAGLLLLAGCRYQDMNAVGPLGAAPFAELRCDEPGNPEGFSFEIPACECSGGILVRYVVRPAGDRWDVHYEVVAGFRDGNAEDDIRMVSRSGRRLERLFVGPRELPAVEDADGQDRAQWDLARESFETTMANYRPVIERAFRTCAEDRSD
jgi:hypothetical protein